MLAQASRSPLPFAPDTGDGETSESRPRTLADKLWLSGWVALMAAVMMAWLGFLGWSGWWLWRLVAS